MRTLKKRLSFCGACPLIHRTLQDVKLGGYTSKPCARTSLKSIALIGSYWMRTKLPRGADVQHWVLQGGPYIQAMHNSFSSHQTGSDTGSSKAFLNACLCLLWVRFCYKPAIGGWRRCFVAKDKIYFSRSYGVLVFYDLTYCFFLAFWGCFNNSHAFILPV